VARERICFTNDRNIIGFIFNTFKAKKTTTKYRLCEKTGPFKKFLKLLMTKQKSDPYIKTFSKLPGVTHDSTISRGDKSD